MKKDRRAVPAAASAVLALAAVARAAVPVPAPADNLLFRPIPPCGDFIACWPKPHPKPWPQGPNEPIGPIYEALGGLQEGAAGVSKSIQEGKIDQAGKALDGLFYGSGAKPGSADADVAGAWNGASSGRLLKQKEDPNKTVFNPPPPKPYAGDDAKIVHYESRVEGLAGNLAAAVVQKGVEKAVEAAEKHADRDQTQESKEKYGGCRMKGTCGK